MKKIILIISAVIICGLILWFFIKKDKNTPKEETDTLIIISPNKKSIQNEFVPKFKEYYKKKFNRSVFVDWVDQGGASNGVKFVRSKFNSHPSSSGIDIFWGGGSATFIELSRDGLLEKYRLPPDIDKNIPENFLGIELKDPGHTWVASALSSFGIFYNKKILEIEHLPPLKNWESLGNPEYFSKLILADSRRSASANTLYNIIIQSLGWDKGWDLLIRISGNAKNFTASSSNLSKSVISGDVAATLLIDFYALSQIAKLGSENLGLLLPPGQTIYNADPIAILKGAPNLEVAKRFINFILTPEAQKLYVLPLGQPDGPKYNALARMAVLPIVYEQTKGRRIKMQNPFKMKSCLNYDLDKASKMKRTFDDLFGVIAIDTHSLLTKAWKKIIERGLKESDLKTLAKMPITEKQLIEIEPKWSDDIFRNKTINDWVRFAQTKYKALIEGKPFKN